MTELIIAADINDEKALEGLLEALAGKPVWIKLGLEALNAFGLGVVGRVKAKGFKVFADVKFHDIPNTVGAASRVLARTGVDLFNVHCSGGRAMCAAALEQSAAEATALGIPRPKVAGVTVLTSLDLEDLSAMGFQGSPRETALRLARVGLAGGLDGVVCSVHEAQGVKEVCGGAFLTICPGIRPSGSSVQDQKRVATPRGAVEAGADYIVVGRPITGAPNPAEACEGILRELAE